MKSVSRLVNPFRATLLATVLTTFSLIAAAQTAAPLKLERTIPLPGVAAKFDHLAIDLVGNRLFVAATGNHSVEVIDLKTDKIQQSITGLGKPHGLAWVAGNLYVADGTLGELRFYTGSPLAVAGKIKLSDDADDMVYDAANHLLFVGHGTGDAANPTRVAIVDTAHFTLVSNLSVATHPEALDIDPATHRVFVNIADSAEVAVIDTNSKKIIANWKLTKGSSNVPMAFNADDHTLLTACRTPGTLVTLDSATGKELTTAPSAGGADDLFYNPALRQAYLISGLGEIDSYTIGKSNALSVLPVLKTAAGAKTGLLVPEQNLLYLAVPGTGVGTSEIRVYSTAKTGAKE